LSTFEDIVSTPHREASEDAFILQVRATLGENIWNADAEKLNKACEQYYTFAKRYLFVDSSVDSKALTSKLIISFAQDKIFEYSNSTLNRIESFVDEQIRRFNIEHKLIDNNVVFYQRARRISLKFKILGSHIANIGLKKIK